MALSPSVPFSISFPFLLYNIKTEPIINIGSANITTYNAANAPTCALPIQTMAFSYYNYLSAQLTIDPKTVRLIVGGVKEQAVQAWVFVPDIFMTIHQIE